MTKSTTRVFLLAALAIAGPALAANTSKSEFDQAYQQAQAAHERAGKAGNQWTTTADTLKSAKQAADEDDLKEAMTLAERARALAELELAQARDRHWQKRVPE